MSMVPPPFSNQDEKDDASLDSRPFPFPFAEKKLIRNFFISSFRSLQKYWRVGHPATKQLSSRGEICGPNFIPLANAAGPGSLKDAFWTISNLSE